MPPRRRGARVTPKTSPSKAPTTFHSFPLLPPEIRQHIWLYTLETSFVPIKWNSTRRQFTSIRQPSALLHVDRESRAVGLKHYTLSFASSPEFARVHFNFKIDILYIDWEALGAAPGRLGRKIRAEEMGKVEMLLINEASLLEHAEENMRELSKFRGLNKVAVICDKEMPDSGAEYGAEELAEYSETIDEPGDERWPGLLCLRDRDEVEMTGEDPDDACSRHWWFDGWNQRSFVGQKMKWGETMSECLKMTLMGEDDIDMWEMGMMGFHMGFSMRNGVWGPWH